MRKKSLTAPKRRNKEKGVGLLHAERHPSPQSAIGLPHLPVALALFWMGLSLEMTHHDKIIASFGALLILAPSNYVLVPPANPATAGFMVALNIFISAFLIILWHKQFVSGIDRFVAYLDKNSRL